jgi:predicted DNA-binding transcriptional regulator AlpA
MMIEHEIKTTLERIESLLLAQKNVYNVEDLSRVTGYSKSFIYKACSSRELPHSSPRHGRIFFDRDAINSWLLSNPIPTKLDLVEQASNYLLTGNLNGGRA